MAVKLQNSNDTIEACITKGIHRDTIRTVKQSMPDLVALYELADLFKLFGDSTRIGILWALSESEMCVCDLCALLKMKQPAVSHQLKNLKQSRVVKARRDGKIVYYSLDDEHIRRLLNLGMEHVRESQPGRAVNEN
jgi:ArsR family transcriptional regulator